MTHPVKNHLILMMALGLMSFFTACSEDDTADPEVPEDPATEEPAGADVQLINEGTFGDYLTDSEGRTLYFFTNDANGKSACEGGCEAAWPIFHADDLSVGEGLEASDFSSITRPDGSKQTTFKGWPLYRFASDTNAGDITGDGSGDVWFVAKPDYSIMLANQDIAGIEGESNRYLVDANGNTLYFFLNDEEGVSNCEGGCLASWPSFAGDDELILPSGLSVDDFATITGTDGQPQRTYRGRPMYYFAQDQQRGDVIGEGASDVWFVFNEANLERVKEEEVPQAEQEVTLENSDAYGSYLVDAEGKTLYYYTKDTYGKSVCDGACESAWPVFYMSEIAWGEGLKGDDFATITRPDGSKQTTYKGWPLYYYAGDDAGDILGEGIGNVWFVAKPDYSLMLADQAPEGADESVKYLVDAEGNTLYYFLNDEENVSNCTGGCLDVWPAYTVEETLYLPSSLDEKKFWTIDRSEGGKQLTYLGKPLYHYAQDDQRGDTKGHTVDYWTVSEIPQ